MSKKNIIKFAKMMGQTDPNDVLIEVTFVPEGGCSGGCGRYELTIEYPVKDGNCRLDSLITYTEVSDYEEEYYCCSGLSGKIHSIWLDLDILNSNQSLDDAITVYDFIMEYGPYEIQKKLIQEREEKIYRNVVEEFKKGNTAKVGSMVWAEGRGRQYKDTKTKPFKSADECIAAKFEGKEYTKDQLYFMAKAMDLKVNRKMSKAELCYIISLSQ
jgi:hypothetical protein